MIGVWCSRNPVSHMRLRMLATTSERSVIFRCIASRRRSRKRYRSRVSSGYSWSPKTISGSSSAAPRTSMSRMKTSTSPVGILGFTSSGARAFTSPSMRMHHSDRTPSTSLKTGLSGSHSTCVIP